MAKFEIVHASDSVAIHVKGDIKNPEPSSAMIIFPGGNVEVSRCSDGSYWVHIKRNVEKCHATGNPAGEIIDSRIDYTPEAWVKNPSIPPIPAHEDIQHIAVRIEKGLGF